MPIRIYIVEDHPVMRGTLVEFLGEIQAMEVVGAAASAEEALKGIPGCGPSLVLVDLSLPGEDGFSLLEAIRERWDLPCVVLTGEGRRDSVEQARAAGARGYVQKGRPLEVAEAIREVADGGSYFSGSSAGEEGSESSEAGR